MIDKRFMRTGELSARLKDYAMSGIVVPALRRSLEPPMYLGTHGHDVHYRHCGIPKIVRPGQVIDDHGNVVDLGYLGHLAWATKQKPSSTPQERRLH